MRSSSWGRIAASISVVKINSMTPLYYGRTAGLVVESQDMGSDTFEREVIQARARTFEELKSHLTERWGSS